MYDILIKNGLIFDGSGDPPYFADLAVKSGEISKIAAKINQPAEYVINANGHVVSPGFIDAHTHDDLVLFNDPYNKPKLLQGVTTVVAGNCGFGLSPNSRDTVSSFIDYTEPVFGEIKPENAFSTFEDYANALDCLEKGQNIAALLGHGSVYIAANDFNDIAMDSAQIAKCCESVRNAMEHGAVGVSVGYMYAPGCYSDAESLRPLTDIIAEYKGLLCVHLRSESEFIDDAIREAMDSIKLSGVSLHISHLKNIGKMYQGNISRIISQLEQDANNGVDVTFDMYPYTAGSTTMSILIPNKMLTKGVRGCLQLLEDENTRKKLEDELKVFWKGEDNLSLLCGWENVVISSLESERNFKFVGKSVAEAAETLNLSSEATCIKLFREEQGKITIILKHIFEKDMLNTITSPKCILGSDGINVGKVPHPRTFGAFPAFLRMFVREKKLITLEEAVKKITSMPARRFGLGKRGFLREGFVADIVVFNSETITDRATFTEPCQYPEGVSLVIVSGEVVCENGVVTEKKPGRFLRYKFQ